MFHRSPPRGPAGYLYWVRVLSKAGDHLRVVAPAEVVMHEGVPKIHVGFFPIQERIRVAHVRRGEVIETLRVAPVSFAMSDQEALTPGHLRIDYEPEGCELVQVVGDSPLNVVQHPVYRKLIPCHCILPSAYPTLEKGTAVSIFRHTGLVDLFDAAYKYKHITSGGGPPSAGPPVSPLCEIRGRGPPRTLEEHQMKVYLDHSVVSAIAKNDMPAEAGALATLQEFAAKGKVHLLSSKVTEREIAPYEGDRKEDLEREYKLLAEAAFHEDHKVLGFHSHGDQWTWISTPLVEDESISRRLRQIGLDKMDAHHLMVAIRNECKVFLTCDARTILNRRAEIEAEFPIQRRTPLEFVGELDE